MAQKAEEGRPGKGKGTLSRSLPAIMYGYGDDANPRDDTVALMETMVSLGAYVHALCSRMGGIWAFVVWCVTLRFMLCMHVCVKVRDHLYDVLSDSVRVAEWRQSNEVDDYCIMWSIRQDANRFGRIRKLLETNEDIKVSECVCVYVNMLLGLAWVYSKLSCALVVCSKYKSKGARRLRKSEKTTMMTRVVHCEERCRAAVCTVHGAPSGSSIPRNLQRTDTHGLQSWLKATAFHGASRWSPWPHRTLER